MKLPPFTGDTEGLLPCCAPPTAMGGAPLRCGSLSHTGKLRDSIALKQRIVSFVTKRLELVQNPVTGFASHGHETGAQDVDAWCDGHLATGH